MLPRLMMSPSFAETSYTIAEDGSITITEASLLENVTDVDNDDAERDQYQR